MKYCGSNLVPVTWSRFKGPVEVADGHCERRLARKEGGICGSAPVELLYVQMRLMINWQWAFPMVWLPESATI